MALVWDENSMSMREEMPKTPDGFAQGPDGLFYNGGGEAPIMNPQYDPSTNSYRNMNGGFGANYTPIRSSEVMNSWNATPAKYRDALSSRGFDPIAYATIHGGAPSINNDADFNNAAQWWGAIQQTPSYRGEGNFDNPFGGLMSMYGDLKPFLSMAGMAYGLGSGLGGLFGGEGLTGEFMGPMMENGLASPSMFGPPDPSWFGSVDGTAGGLGNLLGDPSYWSGADAITGGAFNPNALDSIGNMQSGLDTIGSNMSGSGMDLSSYYNPATSLDTQVSSLNPDTTALSDTMSLNPTSDMPIEPKQFIDDAGRGTNAAGDMVDAQGNRAWQDVMSEKLRPSMGVDGAGSLTNNLSNAWTKLTNPIGGGNMNKGGLQSLFKAPTPLELGVRAFGSIDSWNQGKKAQGLYEDMMNRTRGFEDSNAARGQFANNEWTRAQSDPMYGYDSFMQGAGRDFVNQARAAAAKNGSRGGYMNGKMQSDLAGLWQKNQTQRAASLAGGFSTNPYSSSATLTPGYANLVKNENAPLYQGLQGAMDMFKLSDLFNGA